MTQPLTFFYDPTVLSPAALSDGALAEEDIFPGVELTDEPFGFNRFVTCPLFFHEQPLAEKNSFVEEVDEI